MNTAVFHKCIQVAGIIDSEELNLVLGEGAKLIGFPLRLPVNKPDLSDQKAKEIISSLPPDVYSVLITYLDDAQEIVTFSRYLGMQIVQIHGGIAMSQLQLLKRMAAELLVIKSLVVGESSVDSLRDTLSQTEPYVDAFITDTFDPATGKSGATGKVHDWSVSRNLVEMSQKPVILAGGLTPENVIEATEFVKPAGVDSHTGLEDATGRKDRAKVRQFIENARIALKRVHG